MKISVIKNIIYLLVCVFVYSNQTFAQVIKYQFLPRNENMKERYGVNAIDSMFIWTASQINISDSIFKFGPIECQSDSNSCCSIIFKVDFENNWYIIDPYNNNKEYLFYDNRSKRVKPVYLEQCDLLYEPFSYSQIIDDQLIYAFEIKTPGYTSGDNVVLWFSKTLGIIAECSGITCYVRNDFIDIISQ